MGTLKPAPNGHFRSLKHGAYSARKINPPARELQAALVEARPDLEEHVPAVWAWARCESRILLLEEWLCDHEMIDDDGNVAEAVKLLNQLEKTAITLRTRLGLDPMSQAKLASERASATLTSFDLEEARKRGREALERSA